MKINIEPLKKWFGFSRRERRSAFILLMILIIVFILRYSVPASNISINYLPAGFSDFENNSGSNSIQEKQAGRLFKFNPNTASFDTLLKLGLSTSEANTLIKYRSKGGKFRMPADLRKIYGIDEKQVERIIPFVELKTDTFPGTIKKIYSKKRILVDINSCDSAALDMLPGIGPVLSVRILKYRKLLGGFANIDQLKEVYGLPPETFDIIKDRVYADTLSVSKTRINSADYKLLSRIPYIEKYEVTAILKYRELKGDIKRTRDLIDNKLLTEEKVAKIRAYLKFD